MKTRSEFLCNRQKFATILTFFSLRRLSSSHCTHGNFFIDGKSVLTFIKQLWVVTIHGREILTEDCVLKMWKSLFVSYFEWFSNFNFSQKKLFSLFAENFPHFFFFLLIFPFRKSQSDYLLRAFLIFFLWKFIIHAIKLIWMSAVINCLCLRCFSHTTFHFSFP